MIIQRYCAIVPLLFIPLFSFELGKLIDFNFDDLNRDPCLSECQCESAKDAEELYNEWRFIVNCSGYPHSSLPKNLPFSTTDLIVAGYNLGLLKMDSFPNHDFPLNPKLLTVSLKNCNIDYLYPGTFRGNSFVSVRVIDLSDNVIELVAGGAFRDLQRVHNISMQNNSLQIVQRGSFKNLPEVYAICLKMQSVRLRKELLIAFHF